MLRFRTNKGIAIALRVMVGLLLLTGSTGAFSQPNKRTGGTSKQLNRVSTQSELSRLYNISAMPVYINGTEVHQISSYDRKGGNNDGFEGTYSYLRKENDSSLIVFEAEGKGVIERIWTPTPTDDTLEFYFDGARTPSYAIKYRDVFSGTVFPFVSPIVGHKVGGFYSYLPIPFENGCRIVFKGKKILFHQFQYRKLDNTFSVKTFNPAFTAEDKKLINDGTIKEFSQRTYQLKS
jgi:hypothetical protein